MAASEHAVTCRREVRRHDYDRYLCALLAPAQAREAVLVLTAFNLELARVCEMVSEPLIGEIRLQWWRDALDGIFAGALVGFERHGTYPPWDHDLDVIVFWEDVPRLLLVLEALEALEGVVVSCAWEGAVVRGLWGPWSGGSSVGSGRGAGGQPLGPEQGDPRRPLRAGTSKPRGARGRALSW